jgi:predicted glycosyltransferase
LYSHDAVGIGHLRRNLLIAQSLAGPRGGASVLMMAGVPEATAFRIPPRVDVLTLPALRKEADGVYQPRRLGIPSDTLLGLRAGALRAALESFEPDLLIVDKLPLGVAEELRPALHSLRAAGRTRCVLGLRDVLDDPQRVRADWERRAYPAAVEEFYSAVWVYGDPRVYDPVREYAFDPSLAAKVRYTGYLERPATAEDDDAAVAALAPAPGTRLALCMVGGGEDGAALAESFARAPLPDDMQAVVLEGPFMPPDARRRLLGLAAANPRLRVLDFIPEPAALLRRADCVITMGGYNCVCEALSAGKRPLVVPRVNPRIEQLIRARRLGELGLLDVLHPDDATPEALSRWLHDFNPTRRQTSPREAMDFSGLERLPELMNQLLREGRRRRPEASIPFMESASHAAQ